MYVYTCLFLCFLLFITSYQTDQFTKAAFDKNIKYVQVHLWSSVLTPVLSVVIFNTVSTESLHSIL